MRKLLLAVAAAAAVILTAPAMSSRAVAMPLPGATDLSPAIDATKSVQDVRTVCRTYWNGYRWKQRCWWVGPRYYRPYRPYRHYRRYYRY